MTNWILEFINAFFMLYAFSLFFNIFSKRRFDKKFHILFFTAIVLLFSFILILVSGRISRVILLLLLTIVLSMLYRMKWSFRVFLSVLVYALGMLSELITTVLLSVIFSIPFDEVVSNRFSYVIGILISKLFTFSMIFAFRIFKQKRLYSDSLRRNFSILLIPFSTILVMLLEYYFFMLLSEPTSTIFPFSVLCNTFLIVSNIIVLETLEQIYKNKEREVKLEFAGKLIEEQKMQYRQLVEHNNRIAKLRHDQQNFDLGLISLLEQEKTPSALNELRKHYNQLQSPHKSEYPLGIIGTILYAKSNVAVSKGIFIEFTHAELSKINISEMDLAILLGNALDNAIEATEKLNDGEEKTIYLSIKVHNNQIVIVVKNKVEKDLDVGMLESTKENSRHHGYGIPSMKDIVAKHSGDIIFSCENKQFEVYTILKNNT